MRPATSFIQHVLMILALGGYPAASHAQNLTQDKPATPALKLKAEPAARSISKVPATVSELESALLNSPASVEITDSFCKSCENNAFREPTNSDARRMFGIALACRGNYDDAKHEFLQASDLADGKSKYEAEQDIGRLQILIADSSAETWAKVCHRTILSCPDCYRTRRIIPAVYAPITPLQQQAVADKKLFLIDGAKKDSPAVS